MNTNTLKSFARNARLNLCEAVNNQLLFWGFNENGETDTAPVEVGGGFLFREKIYDNPSTYSKWEKLQERIDGSKVHYQDVVEEAAYTWFNRLVAIKILEENKFIDPVVSFVEGSRIPTILQQAKSGNHTVTHSGQRKLLQEALLNNKDEEAFAILILDFCHKHPLLNTVFGKPDDYTEILIPQNLLSSTGFLVQLNDEETITKESFQEVELIGWLYQFYISDKKDEVFKNFNKNKKARAEDIPAATQIFTPRWIVEYMVQNTIGKLYLDFEDTSELQEEMKYLVKSDEEEENDVLIEDLDELTLIDPASGSGHILVVGLEWLFKMYREQGYTAKMAIEHILKHNLYGLDIDTRAMQLGRFAVLLKSAQLLEESLSGEGRVFVNQENLLLPHNYVFPEERSFVSEDIELLTDNQHVNEIYNAFKELRQGKNIGAALKINLSQEAQEVLSEKYTDWHSRESLLDLQEQAVWETLKDYIEVALVMTKRYAGVAANPPYMGQKNMNAELKEYLNKHYPISKSDLFAVFIEQMMQVTRENALMSCITMKSWMFLSSYEKLRKHILSNYSILGLGHFGWHIIGIAFGTNMMVLENSKRRPKGEYSYLTINDIDTDKNEPFIYPKKDNGRYAVINQSNFEKIPGSPIAYWMSDTLIKLFDEDLKIGDIAEISKGMVTANNAYFVRYWYEVDFTRIGYDYTNSEDAKLSKNRWFPYAKGKGYKKWYGDNFSVVNWENDGFLLRNTLTDDGKRVRATNFNLDKIFKSGISWNVITTSSNSFRLIDNGFLYDAASGICQTNNDQSDLVLLGYLNSKIPDKILELINPTINLHPGYINKIPFTNRDSIPQSILEKANNSIVISKRDWDSRESSWDFEENPLIKQQANSLQDAYENWKVEATQDFFQLHKNEEELNRIFIDIYGLQDELNPEVLLKDITILQDEIKSGDLEDLEESFRAQGQVDLPIQSDVVIQQFLSYLIGVIFGRYRLDKPGLHIAHPNPTAEELEAYQVENVALPFKFTIDDDAILPIMGSASSFRDDALQQIQNLVYHIWGEETQNENLNFINNSLGMSLEKWLSDRFWKQYHIKGNVYGKKPIYWLFSSNQRLPHRSAFQVLVYMHRMDAYTVQKIRQNYLHPQQKHVREVEENHESNEANLTRQELRELDTLRKHSIEMPGYDGAMT